MNPAPIKKSNHMMRSASSRPSSRTLFALLVGGALGLSALLQSGVAEAGRGHFSGRVRFSGAGRWHGGISVRARPAWRPSWRPYSRVWIGGYYAPRTYYYYPYYPEAVPSYYGAYYYPVQPQPQYAYPQYQGQYEGQYQGPSAPVAVAAEPPLPVFGIGVFAGGTSIHDSQESTDFGALVRFRLTPGLILEGELAKTEFEDSVRVDRRIGGSLIYEIGARNSVAPYILVGGGVQQAKVDGDFTTTQDYGEVGVGLRIALSRNLHLAADIRAGRRGTVDSDQPVYISDAARSVAPPSGSFGDDDTEDYARGRVAAILNF